MSLLFFWVGGGGVLPPSSLSQPPTTEDRGNHWGVGSYPGQRERVMDVKMETRATTTDKKENKGSHHHDHHLLYKFKYINKVVIMNRHGHNNIRNGIVWVQTGHSTSTCTATLCVIEPRTHQKFESFKKIPQRRKSNSNLLINSKNSPKSFELVSGRMVSIPVSWNALDTS